MIADDRVAFGALTTTGARGTSLTVGLYLWTIRRNTYRSLGLSLWREKLFSFLTSLWKLAATVSVGCLIFGTIIAWVNPDWVYRSFGHSWAIVHFGLWALGIGFVLSILAGLVGMAAGREGDRNQ